MTRITRRLSARRGTERGVTIVEAAFALPILLTFIFGLIDLGMWTFNANQSTNAARDGARAAIIDFRDADDDGSAHHVAIVDAVEARLAGQEVESVEVTCVDADGVALSSCDAAVVDRDSIRVDVRWNWNLLTPVAAILGYDQGAATGSATMQIVGRPLAGSSTTSTTTTTTPDTTSATDCVVAAEDLTVSPDPITTSGNGASQLSEALVVSFETNGSEACAPLWVELYNSKDGKQVARVQCGCGDHATDFSWSYVGSNNVWKAGTGQVRVLVDTRVLQTKDFQVQQGS
jgi:Flp pilus assembly protein TadG